MHFLMFQMKRAHLSSLRAARELCEELAITPARFDLMRAVATVATGTPQKELWKILGLSRICVSRMVRILIERGLLRRERSRRDRRTFVVALTEEGALRMHRAYGRIHKERPFQIRYEGAFGEAPANVVAVLNLNWALRCSAQHIGDYSWELYRTRDPD